MKIEEALELVGVGRRMDPLPSQLSGCEQQRVAIARAVAKRPDIIRRHEPTGVLDNVTGEVILEALARFNSAFGTTTATITHNAAIAAAGDRVILHPPQTLKDGTKVRVLGE